MDIKIKKITLLHSATGPDTLFLHTNLQPSTWPYRTSPTLKLDVAACEGKRYCESNFPGIPVEEISV